MLSDHSSRKIRGGGALCSISEEEEHVKAETCFMLPIGRASKYFTHKFRNPMSEEKLNEAICQMMAVIQEYENQLYEYKNGKVYPRNVLLNKSEWMKKYGT